MKQNDRNLIENVLKIEFHLRTRCAHFLVSRTWLPRVHAVIADTKWPISQRYVLQAHERSLKAPPKSVLSQFPWLRREIAFPDSSFPIRDRYDARKTIVRAVASMDQVSFVSTNIEIFQKKTLENIALNLARYFLRFFLPNSNSFS